MQRWLIGAMLAAVALHAPVTADDGIEIGGRVLAPGPAPVARAQVTLLPRLDALATAAIELAGTDPEPVAGARTDAAGRFTLVAPGAGLWLVRVEVDGFTPLELELLPLIEPVELPDAVLSPDSGIKVRVRAADGAPLPGADVLVRTDRDRRGFGASPDWSIPLRAGRTGDDGTLRLPRGENERTLVSAAAPGRAPGERRGVFGTAAAIELAPGVSRRLEVRGADGSAVPGVRVALGDRAHLVGTTDEQGRLTANLAPARTTPVDLLAPDGRRSETSIDASTPPPAQDRPLVLTLPARLTLRGRVIDAESRRAVAGGIVWDRGDPTAAAVTGNGGGFELAGVSGRRLELEAGAPGYLRADPVSHQLLGDGRPAPTLALRPAAAVRGKVVDGDGNPVPGAEVRAEIRRRPGMMRIEIGRPQVGPRNRSNPQGEFRIGPLDPEQSYSLAVQAEGHAPATAELTGLEPYRTRSGLVLTLDRGKRVVGRLVDTDGAPLRDGSIELSPATPGRNMGMMRVMDGGAAAASFRATSDGEGRFELGGLPAGTHDLVAKRPGFARRSVPGIELAGDAAAVDVGDVILEPGHRLQGRATDRDGNPVEGVEVRVQESGPMTFSLGGSGDPVPPDAFTDPGGWFTIDDLAASPAYSLGLDRAGYVGASAGPVTLPRPEPLEVTLDAASRLSGVVRAGGGEPIPGAQVNLSRSRTIEMGGAVMKMMMLNSEDTDARGRFVFEDQEPGTVSLSASASGHREAKLDGVEIPRGEDVDDVVLELEPGAVISGRVTRPDGRPAIGARVAQVGEGDGMMRMLGGVPADGEGHYWLEGLAPGEVSIEATHPDHPRTVRDLEVEVGLNELDLTFEGGVEVTGQVSDTAGAAVGDAAVRLLPAGRMWGGPETISGPDGRFRLPGVEDGDYRLRVEAAGYAPHTAEQAVTVSGEPVHGLAVQLETGGAIHGRVRGVEPAELSKVGVRADGLSIPGFGGAAVDFEGNYRIENLAPGSYNVVATLAESGRQARGQAALEPGVTEVRLDLEFGGGLELRGRAVQGERPVSGATLLAEGRDVDHDGWGRTDTDGAFAIDGLEPGTYDVHLRNWQTGLAYDETVELSASREVVLEVPTARVRGRIYDSADREPLAGVGVTLRAADGGGTGRLPLHSATTDLEGKFELPNVGDGSWQLSAERKGYAAVSRGLTVQFQKPVEDLELPMDPTEGLTLEARLPTGAAPAELRVAVIDGSGMTLVGGNFATGENGRVRLSTVPPGSFTLVVSAAGSAVSNLAVRAPGPAVPVTLQPATALRVVVPELSGSPTLATVRVADAAGRSFHALSWNGNALTEWRMAGGRLELGSLPPGSWTVTVDTADGRSWRGRTATAVGAAAELSLQ